MLAAARAPHAVAVSEARAWKACPMNVSSACPQCGTIANPNDRFCNTCGTPLQRPASGGAAGGAPGPGAQMQSPPAGYVPPQPPPAQPYAPPQQAYPQPAQPYAPAVAAAAAGVRPQRCQLGHDILPGMSYCAQGHPLALDAMQFANDPGAGGYPAPPPGPPPPPPPYAQQAPQGYGAPAGSPFDAPRPVPQPPQAGFGPPGYPQQPSYGQQQAYGQPQAYGQAYAPQPVFQGAAVPPGQYAPPPPPPGMYADPAIAATAMPPTGKLLRAFLVSFQTNPQGDFWPLFTGRTTLGRANAAEPADVPLADATISSRHAALLIDQNVVWVEDTNSTNGTYVNEEHIGQNGKRELRDGDRLRLGGYTTLVKIVGRMG